MQLKRVEKIRQEDAEDINEDSQSIVNNNTNNNGVVTAKEIDETKQYTKRQSLCLKFEIICLIGVAISYLIYGLYKYYDSYQHPLVKYSENSISKYDYPVISACINATNFSGGTIYPPEAEYYIGLVSILNVCDDINSCFKLELSNDLFVLEKSKKRSQWQIYEGGFSDDNGANVYCYIIIPSTDSFLETSSKSKPKLNSKHVVTFELYRNGMFDNDNFFGNDSSVPSFVINQYKYSIEHQSFHIDELYATLENNWGFVNGDEIEIAWLLAAAYETGTSAFYAPYCSRSDLEIQLATYESYYDNKKTNSYIMQSYGASIDTSMYDSSYWDTGVAHVGLYYYPKTKGKEINSKNHNDDKYLYYQSYGQEYLEYDLASLFSGLGGIIGIAQTFFAIVMPILLLGIAIKLFCGFELNFNGVAPYPEFEREHQEKLHRFLRANNYVQK